MKNHIGTVIILVLSIPAIVWSIGSCEFEGENTIAEIKEKVSAQYTPPPEKPRYYKHIVKPGEAPIPIDVKDRRGYISIVVNDETPGDKVMIAVESYGGLIQNPITGEIDQYATLIAGVTSLGSISEEWEKIWVKVPEVWPTSTGGASNTALPVTFITKFTGR